jgi:hypothetical protein
MALPSLVLTLRDGTTRYINPKALGDVEGHPFHGNQWTGGGGESRSAFVRSMGAHEDKIRHEPNEHAVLVNPDGTSTTLTSNAKDYVVVDEVLNLKDVVLTHNHPQDYSLSTEDALLAERKNLSEIRAVVSDGTYSLRRTGSEWPSDFKETIQKEAADVRQSFEKKIALGSMTIAEANAKHYGELWTRVARSVNAVGSPRILYTFDPKS